MNWTLGYGLKFSYTYKRHIGATLENQDTCAIRTLLVVPEVSALFRFHCSSSVRCIAGHSTGICGKVLAYSFL